MDWWRMATKVSTGDAYVVGYGRPIQGEIWLQHGGRLAKRALKNEVEVLKEALECEKEEWAREKQDLIRDKEQLNVRWRFSQCCCTSL